MIAAEVLIEDVMADRKTVKQLRDERKLSQFELAYAADVSLSTIVDVERGRVSPRVGTARKIAVALGVGIDDIDWPDPHPPQRKRRE